MAYYLSDSQFQQLNAIMTDTSATKEADFYDLVSEFLSEIDGAGPAADPSVRAWFGAAAQTNRGVGGPSDFIRGYTETQLEIRAGAEIANIDQVLQDASNDIAEAVFREISASFEVRNGSIVYRVPDLGVIGDEDASQSLAALAPYTSSPAAAWSGAPLFIGLGDESFWDEFILNDIGDTYDLFVSLTAFKNTSVSVATNPSSVLDLGALFWSQGSQGRTDASAAAASAAAMTSAFLSAAYGSFAPATVADLFTNNIDAGSEHDDELIMYNGFTSTGFLNAGAGNDTIVGTTGNDLFDGGDGQDVVTFMHPLAVAQGFSEVAVTVNLSHVSSTAEFSAHLTGAGINSAVFNVEKLNLGNADDTLIIRDLVSGVTSLELVDGGRDVTGDTIDLHHATHGAVVSLEDGTVGSSPEEGSTRILDVVRFENVIGTSYNDEITGSAGANVVSGGGGSDTIYGGGGDDLLIGGTGADALVGGDGHDTLYFDPEGSGVSVDLQLGTGVGGEAEGDTYEGIEAVVGTNQSDTFHTSPTVDVGYFAGSGGADHFILNGFSSEGASGSTAVIWGGEGADVIEATGNVSILIVNAPGLTEENFHLLDITDSSQFGGLDATQFDIVLVDPDAADRIIIDGDVAGVGHMSSVEVGNPDGGLPDQQPTLTLSGSSYTAPRLNGSLTPNGVKVGNMAVNISGLGVVDAFTVTGVISYDMAEEFYGHDGSGSFTPWDDEYQYMMNGRSPGAAVYTSDVLPGSNYEVDAAAHKTYVFSGGVIDADNHFGSVSEAFSNNVPWFLVGGSFSGTHVISNNHYAVTLPATDPALQTSVYDFL